MYNPRAQAKAMVMTLKEDINVHEYTDFMNESPQFPRNIFCKVCIITFKTNEKRSETYFNSSNPIENKAAIFC